MHSCAPTLPGEDSPKPEQNEEQTGEPLKALTAEATKKAFCPAAGKPSGGTPHPPYLPLLSGADDA